MKPPVKKVVVYVVDFARNAIKMRRNAALRQILNRILFTSYTQYLLSLLW